MTSTLTTVPLAKIKPREGFNPRSEFADEQMAELVESVKQHGIITPLTLAPDGDRFMIVAGERRYRAAKQAKLKEVPAQVRDGEGDALTLAVAENVIRADLNPVDEARAYERLVAEHGNAAKVAKLVGRSEKLIGDRLDLLCLPDEAQALLAARKVPLACAPALMRIAVREPLLAELAAVWLTERPRAAAGFPTDPGEVVDDVLEAEWQDDDGQPLCPVAYSVGGYYGPLLPGGRNQEEQLPRILAKLGDHGGAVAAAYAGLPEIPHDDDYDWQARQAEEQRERECFSLTDEDADAARAFGCLLELPGPGEAMLWTAYVNGGTVPRGADFMRAVRELAERAGVDPSPLERSQPRDRRADLLRDFFGFCRFELVGEGGAEARAYLESRSFPEDAIADSGLGVVPAAAKTRSLLERAGYRPEEIAKAGILTDSRWPGRLCGAWRDGYGKIGTFWARSLDRALDGDSRYLYLRGATRTNLPPYGLSDGFAKTPHARREIALVEGFFDLHQLRARGIENVAALGGTSVSSQTFERLHRLGIDAITLCLDSDDAGRAAVARAVEHSARARRSPDVHVVDPARLAPAKDPDELVREGGPAAWNELLTTRTCGIAWRAHELAAVTRDSPVAERRAALARAGEWLGGLPPRLALEQEDAVRAVAEQCGYSAKAVERAFQARFFRELRVERDQAAPGRDDRRMERVIER